MSNFLTNNPLTRFFRNVLGPAAIMAAGMIGAGAVSTRLLAGTWFGFDLLWVALYVIPMVIFANDSASRVGIMTDRGMMDMVKTEISPLLAWFFFIPSFLLNIVVNISQMSIMVEGSYGALGIPLFEGGAITAGRIITVLVLMAITLLGVLTGGFKRIEKVMTSLLMIILVCFIIVAIKGLLDWKTWVGLAQGLVPQIPEDIKVVGSEGMRRGFTQLMAIAGQALCATVFLSFGYFTSDAEYKEEDIKRSFWKNVLNFGVIWGLFSVVVVVAGVTALHNVYTGAGGGLHFSQIDSVYNAGKVITPALPSAISFLAPRIFSLGLFVAAFTTMISVAMLMTYFCIDIVGKDWRLRKGNKTYQWILALWIVIPALLSPFWQLPGLLQAILAMAGNLVLTPVSLFIIMFFINQKKYMGKYTANIGRNIVLGISFLFSLYVVVYGISNFLKQFGIIG
ncbi:MAG TPA: divalent metal cation transporter [Anaerolineae bacterium]|nr:divalent metal cation transporter [Anaerolineae bacterium]